MSDVVEGGFTPRAPAGLFLHYCEHNGCSKWGSFGYNHGKIESRYVSFDYRPETLAEREEVLEMARFATVA